MTVICCAIPEKIHTPTQKVFCFAPPLPLGNSSLASYFASKFFTFKTLLPLGISNDLPWGEYEFFLNLLQIAQNPSIAKFFDITSPSPSIQNTVNILSCRFLNDLEGKEELVTHTLPYIIIRSLSREMVS